MGAGGSTMKLGKMSVEDVVAMMMPVYYTHDAEISEEMLNTAKESWLQIAEDRSPVILERKKNPSSQTSSGITLFYETFYERLFNVHPMAKPLFKNGMQSQGKFLVKMIAMIINTLKYRDKFKKTIEDLALRHCEMGVKAGEYSIVGDVLFHSLETCLGTAYTREVEDAWKKIYSAMLQIIVPLCLKFESSGNVEQDEGSKREQLKVRVPSVRDKLLKEPSKNNLSAKTSDTVKTTAETNTTVSAGGA